MKKNLTLIYALLLALSFVLSGCQGDAGPAGTPGADGSGGTNGTNGTVGPQGPVGTTGTTGALIADPFKTTQFHGSANAPEALRGPNNSANLCTTITAASVDSITGKLVVDFTVKTSGADKVPCTTDDVAYTGLSSSTMTFRFAQLRNDGTAAVDPTYWVNYVNTAKRKVPGVGFANNTGLVMSQGSGETGSTTGGTWTDNGNGTYRYVTKAKLTDGITIIYPPKAGTYAYDANLTHRVGIQMGDFDGTGSATGGANNAIYDFVPGAGGNGPQVADPREIVVIANCNECHSTLGLHGGGRLDTKLCVICHNPTQGDPHSGNVLDFKIMIHKIHMGKKLPSVIAGTPYKIWGYGTVPSEHDYSYVNFPAYPANCTKCHKIATKANNYKTNPSIEACGACHDGIDFSTGNGTRVTGVSQLSGSNFASSNLSNSNHVGGIKTNADCVNCHQSSGTQGAIDTDPAPIPDRHDFMKKIASPYIVKLTMSAPTNGSYYQTGETPTVTVQMYNATDTSLTTPLDPTMTEALCGGAACGRGNQNANAWNLYVSGPRALRVPVLTTAAAALNTSTAGNDLRTRTLTGATNDDWNGTTKLTGVKNRSTMSTDKMIVYQLAAIPATMTTGTYVAYTYGFFPGNSGYHSMAFKDLVTFQVGTATVEKKVATNCLDCHSSDTEATKTASTVENVWHITSNYEHPAQFDPDYCGNCHDYAVYQDAKTATSTTQGVWGANKLGFGAMPLSKRLHGVHYGARLNHVADNPGTAYSHAALPQDVRNCEKCHPKTTSTDTWKLTSDTQKDSTGLFLTAKTPARAACSGCHDGDNSWIHMTTNTVDYTPQTVATPLTRSSTYPAAGQFMSGPFSGDEQEACKACHAPLGQGAAGTATGTLGALQAPKLTN